MNTNPPPTIGPLNQPARYRFQPGPRMNGRLLVCDDGRVLLIRAGRENYLMMNGGWYQFEPEIKRLTPDPTARAVREQYLNNPCHEIFGEPAEYVVGWGMRCDMGFFRMDEKSARFQACKHRRGYFACGWRCIRPVSAEELAALDA